MLPTFAPAKIALAIGAPLARLFFDPQNMIVMRSGRLKPSNLLPYRGQQHNDQQNDVDSHHHAEIVPRNGTPKTFNHSLAESQINDHQDRASVNKAECFAVPPHETADPWLQNLSEHEGCEQLQQNGFERIDRYSTTAFDCEQQADQQGREKHAENVRRRC